MDQSEQVLETKTIERAATLRVLRVVNFEELADKATTIEEMREAMKAGGTFTFEVQPNGRGADALRVPVPSAEFGAAMIAGFVLAIEMKKKGTRKPNGSAHALARKTKGELIAFAKKNKINIGDAKTKADLLAIIPDPK